MVEEKAEVTPIATAVEETVSEIAPQQLDQTPLTPVGVEEEKSDVQYIKTDLNASKAILVSETQGTKLRKTIEQQKNMVFNSIEEKTETITAEEKPAEAIDSIVDSAQVAPLESKEDIDKQLQAMLEQLRVTTDEDKAAELNSRISELSEKAKILQKAA